MSFDRAGPGEGSPSPPKLSPSASRQSLSSDVTTKTLRKSAFTGPDDNSEAHAFTLSNFILQDKLETRIRNELRATKSISLEHAHRAEEKHEKDKENFPDCESCLCDMTTGASLTSKVAKEAKVVTTGIRGGADKRVLLPAVLELQGEVRTTFQFFMSLAFFLLFGLGCQMHYRTYAIHLQEKNLRLQLTDSATEVNEIPQMFEWMEQTWFPFLWNSPNAAGTTGSLLPSRQLTLLGGSLLKVISSPEEECVYVTGATCYDQGERAYNYDPVLNGWDVHRRLATASDAEATPGWTGPSRLMAFYQWLRPMLPFSSEGWYEAEAPDATAATAAAPDAETPRTPRTRRPVGNLPPKAKRLLQGGLEGLPSKKTKRSRHGWMRAFFEKSEPSSKPRRRLAPTSSVIMDGLPEPVGNEKAAITVIPMSRSLANVSKQLQTWQTDMNRLVSQRTLIVGLETMVRNEQTQLLTHVFVNFLLSRSGAIFVQVRLLSLHTVNDPWAMILAAIWVIFLLGCIVALLAQIIIAFSNGRAAAHAKKMSTLVQWAIVLIGVVIVALFVTERMEMRRAKNLVEDYTSARPSVKASVLEDFDISWFNLLHFVIFWATRSDSDLLILISLFHVLILLQFLAASKGQPRLALLVNTLEKAFQDIVHLFVVFLFIFSAFVIAGHILFGAKLKDFSTVQGSFAKSLEQVVSFKTDWDVITQQDWWTAAIWVWLMIIVVSLVVINIVLAVIFDCYGKIRSGITEKDTLWTTLRRQFMALRYMNQWYATLDLLTGIKNSKTESITQEGFRRIFHDITEEQVEQIFELAEMRAVNDTINGQPTLLGEAIASILLGIDDVRDGIRTLQDKSFKSYKEQRIWLEEFKEPLTAPEPVWDLGPDTYQIVSTTGCDVRDAPDMTSPVVTRLAQRDKVEVVRTKDYYGGDGLRRLMGQLAEPNSGWIPIFDPETGYAWAELWKDPKIKEPDFPGVYIIQHESAMVRTDISLTSPELTELPQGTMVNVVEVVLDYCDEETTAQRKRGRLQHPDGWISLLDRDTNYRFAERAKIQEPFGKWVSKKDMELTVEPNSAEALSTVQDGEMVEIVEMRLEYAQGQEHLFGLTKMGGWMPLQNLATKEKYAEAKPELADPEVPPEEDPLKLPSNPPRWVSDGLLCHLHKQHRNMIMMTEKFQSIQLGFEQKGLNLEPVLPGDEPELPDFESMLKPSHFAQQDTGRVAVRREKPAVNLPQPSATISSQSLKSRLHHFVSSI
ncbi:unnamed protein product [Cladocopium goreaui]|uniref:Polycystin-2 n=1 Tax=Cladocopium goreaui TaxID=2562237 RepID=A0A9P1DHP6_9DINO|nr:unnamed protein product [Cladocopium goreaui]